jgi:uncharacterized protein (DUF2336 family)
MQWVGTAPAGLRAEATGALARAYLYSDLSPEQRAAAEGAMIYLLDDSSPLVRAALAENLARDASAPAAVIHGLASDQPDIASVVLEHSPLFIDADLVEFVATGGVAPQLAIARRAGLQRAVAAAIAEVGEPEACLTLIENGSADIAPFSIDRIVERFGELAAIRETLLQRADLAVATRQAIIGKLSQTLANFVAAREWLPVERAHRVVREACDKATVVIAADAPGQVRGLVRHLRASAQLSAGLILRALLSGNFALFEEAMADLSELPPERVRAIVRDRGGAGFAALYRKAELPESVYPAFCEAVAAWREFGNAGDGVGSGDLQRRMIERVLAGCGRLTLDEAEPMLMLLRRFATEAAREDARRFCKELAEEETIVFSAELDRAAA